MACEMLCIIGWVEDVIRLIGFPFYTVFLAMLVKFRKTELSGPFYTLCLAVGITDQLNSLSRWCTMKVPYMFFYDQAVNSTFMATAAKIGLNYTYYGQTFGICVLALSRLVAIMWPLKKLWNQTATNVSIVFVFLGPLIVVSFMFVHHCRYSPANFYSRFVEPEVNSAFVLYILIADVIMGTFTLLAYLAMFIKIVAVKKNTVASVAKPSAGSQSGVSSSQRAQSIVHRKREIRLALQGGIISCCLWGITIGSILLEYGGARKSAEISRAGEMFYWVFMPLMTVANPFILMTSKSVRACMMEMIRCA